LFNSLESVLPDFHKIWRRFILSGIARPRKSMVAVTSDQ